MATYDVGDTARLRCDFKAKDDNGHERLADPTTAVFQLRNPNNGITTFTYPTDSEVVRLSLGKFKVEQVVNIPGKWTHRWRGTGAVATAGEQEFTVSKSVFPNP